MTDGPQQPSEPQGSDEEFRPKPGQPTVPFRVTPPPADPEQPQSGYGYPQQQPQSGYGYPQQPAYGYPHQPQPPEQPEGPEPEQQPAWAPPAAHIGRTAEPDWSALADRTEENSRRRRKLFMIGGGVVAALVVGGIVATSVVVSGHKHTTAGPTQSPTGSGQPSPTFSDVTPPAAPDPLVMLSSARTDTAPLTTAGLFPGHQLNYPGRTYTQEATASTTSCSGAAAGELSSILAGDGCRKLLRATYYRDGIAVTIGVAVFDTTSAATDAKQRAKPYILPLSGGTVGAFCHSTSCQAAANSVGRYAYFTIAGRTDGTGVLVSDAKTKQCADDIGNFVFSGIVQRGRAEAATAPPVG